MCYYRPMSFDQSEEFLCPYCGRPNSLSVDITGGRNQEFVVDCETCCAPIAVCLKIDGAEIIGIDIRKENE